MAIFPTATAGGLVGRTQAGVCSVPANVENFYCFPNAFTTDCDITGLPTDCTARIEPKQINAIVSELMAFANQLNPTGSWTCENENNLAVNFAAYASTVAGDNVTIGADAPFAVIPEGVANAICGNAAAVATLQGCLVTPITSLLVGDNVTITAAAPFSVIPQGVATAICADPVATQTLAACLLSTDATNALGFGADGLITFTVAAPLEGDGITITTASPYAIIPLGTANAICGDAAARQALAACLLSADADQELMLGTDGLLKYVAGATGGGSIAAPFDVGTIMSGTIERFFPPPGGFGVINSGDTITLGPSTRLIYERGDGGGENDTRAGTWRYHGSTGSNAGLGSSQPTTVGGLWVRVA